MRIAINPPRKNNRDSVLHGTGEFYGRLFWAPINSVGYPSGTAYPRRLLSHLIGRRKKHSKLNQRVILSVGLVQNNGQGQDLAGEGGLECQNCRGNRAEDLLKVRWSGRL